MSTSRPTSQKRKRVEYEEKLARQVERDAGDLRSSLEHLHSSLSTLGDVVVVVQGSSECRRFPCVSALLASASRPLAAMLYGSMCALEQNVEGGKPELHLHGTEPWCFDQLLRYIHGHAITLDVDIAVNLHHVADYYEVLQLRDSCCSILLDALQPTNCCQLLARAEEVHCEPLAARCIDFLTLDFASVVESDPEFVNLDPSVMATVLERNELVCTCEVAVLEALLFWYNQSPREEKYTALPSLLRLLRWHMVPDDQRTRAQQLIGSVRPPCEVEWGASSHERAPQRLRAERASMPSALDLCSVMREACRDENGDGCYSAKQGWSRQCRWGRLVGRSPAEGAAPPRIDEHELVCTKEYMIGRSRKTDIRIGQNAPMPYISSHHFRLFHTIHWPELHFGRGAAPAAPGELPALEPWLEDLSQNGTFINGVLVGRNKRALLKDGDRVELVFPQGRAQATPTSNSFPTYTFLAAPLPNAAGDESQKTGAAGSPSSTLDK
mmetsp:Transcript_26024/g.57030  ORF Transcript_26024/g.57030 Transcript_26024/m.57030 type:complete len:496 (+) Transcript_26024:22-1509(+)